MDKLPLEIVNYLCTYLPPKDIKKTFSVKTIRASGDKIDLVKRKYKKNKGKVRKIILQTDMLNNTFDELKNEWDLRFRMVHQFNLGQKQNLLRISEKLVVKMRIISGQDLLKKKQLSYLKKNHRILKWLTQKRLLVNWL